MRDETGRDAAAGHAGGPEVAPPVAARRTKLHDWHGHRRSDDYDWLRDQGFPKVEDPDILAYLHAENAYTAAVMAPHAALTTRIRAELEGRLQPDDRGVPWFRAGYWHQWRYAPGAQHPLIVRRPGTLDRPDDPSAPETVLIDGPQQAAAAPFFALGSWAVRDDGDLLAWSADLDGSERHVVQLRDLRSGALLPDRLENTSAALVWSRDGLWLFYAALDPQLRPQSIRRHRIGTAQADDVEIHAEGDPRFWMGLGQSADERWLVIASADKATAEVHVLDLASPTCAPVMIAPRRTGHDYDVDHGCGPDGSPCFFIRTNDRGSDYRVCLATDAAVLGGAGEAAWTELVGHRPGCFVSDILPFRHHLVLREREAGLPQIAVHRLADAARHRVAFPDVAFVAAPGDNPRFATSTLRLGYESPARPATIYDYDMDRQHLVTLKVQEIPSGFDPAAYAVERRWARAPDGVAVPMTVLLRRDRPRDGTGPLYLYAYGAYGLSIGATFSPHRFSLVDRGFAVVIAHPRGGSDLGRGWYEAGRLAAKENTFGDVIAVAEAVVAGGLCAAGRIVLSGGSAGGMTVGTVINRRPQMFHAAVARVPFVDVLTTMCDASLPLTPTEYSEWGDPADPAVYARLLAYSPYDNVVAQAYPHLLVTAGLSDPRVTYWEPAKWVAKLRATKTDRNRLLLLTHMTAGHRGASGRYAALDEIALEYAFLLDVVGAADQA